MANSSIIDALVVTLDLDASQFENAVGKAGASVVGLGKKFAGMFLAVEGFESLVGVLRDTNKQIAELGFNADALGVAGTELSKWGEIAHRIGGGFDEAVSSVQGLQSAIFGLQYQGQMSPQLQALQRLGVPYLNANGSPRDPQKIYEDAAAALQQQYPGDDQKWLRNQYAMQVTGGEPGLSRAIANGPGYIADELKKVTEDQAALTQKVIASNEDIYKQGVSLASALQSNAAAINDKLAPAIIELAKDMESFTNGVNELLHPGKLLHDTGSVISYGWDKLFGSGDQQLLPRGLRNNNPGNLKTVGSQPRDAQGFAIFPNMQEGIKAAENQLALYGKRGINTISGILSKWAPSSDGNDTAAYIRFVSQAMHKSANARLSSADYDAMISAMSRFENGSRSSFWKWLLPAGSAQAPSLFTPLLAPPSPGVARGAAAANTTGMAGGHTSSVVINGGMTVVTQAKDANGIAADIAGALRRKMLVANADVGLA